jgi:hypothetical protein
LTLYEQGSKNSFSHCFPEVPMRIRWRIICPSLGLLLIGMIGMAAVPYWNHYWNHLMYPDALSRDDMTRALTHTPRQAIGYAVFPVDRQNDELGAPDHIRTEADARAYIEALVKRWGPDETKYSHLTELKGRLAQAEYSAVRDPERLISESQVAKTFNRLMDEWEMPGWTRISVPELHAFRIQYASVIYPRSVARLPDGSIAPGCRPTEALLLFDFLNFNGGVPPRIREQVRESRFPWSLLKRLKWSRPTPEPPVEYGGPHPEPLTPESRQRGKYWTCRSRYFASHPEITFEGEVSDLFSQLGIH